MNSLCVVVLFGLVLSVLTAPRQKRQAQDDPECQNRFGNNAISCTSFAECWDGVKMSERTCGTEKNSQMKFNPQTGACDWANNVNCEVQQLSGVDAICGQTPQGFEEFAYFAPHSQFCNAYYVCDHGNYRGTRNCIFPHVFDPFTQNCTQTAQCNTQMLPFANMH